MKLHDWTDDRDTKIDDVLVSLQVLLNEWRETVDRDFTNAPTTNLEQARAVQRVQDALHASLIELEAAERSLMTALFRLVKVV